MTVRRIKVPFNVPSGGKATQWILLVQIENLWHVESSELSRILEYSRPRALRENRVLNKLPPASYQLIRRGPFTSQYLTAYEKNIGSVMGRHPLDGEDRLKGEPLIFFTMSGVMALLERSQKAMSDHLKEAINHALVKWEKGPIASSPKVEPPKAPSPSSEPSSRKQDPSNYEVLQTLLSQLQTLPDDLLKHLAVDAAEEALGRDLSRYRPKSAKVFSQVPNPKAPSEPTTPPDPVIHEGEWLSMSRIGKRAGGYTAHQAGKAVTIVAQQLGIGDYAIRNCPMSINRFIEAKDSNGTLRKMVHFRADFARKVVKELQSNSSFEPRVVPTTEESVRPFVEGQFQDLSPGTPNGV